MGRGRDAGTVGLQAAIPGFLVQGRFPTEPFRRSTWRPGIRYPSSRRLDEFLRAAAKVLSRAERPRPRAAPQVPTQITLIRSGAAGGGWLPAPQWRVPGRTRWAFLVALRRGVGVSIADEAIGRRQP